MAGPFSSPFSRLRAVMVGVCVVGVYAFAWIQSVAIDHGKRGRIISTDSPCKHGR